MIRFSKCLNGAITAFVRLPRAYSSKSVESKLDTAILLLGGAGASVVRLQYISPSPGN